jgi:hypothetical protein
MSSLKEHCSKLRFDSKGRLRHRRFPPSMTSKLNRKGVCAPTRIFYHANDNATNGRWKVSKRLLVTVYKMAERNESSNAFISAMLQNALSKKMK